ncbi:MAG TPA: hypothetical protein VI819_04005 [Patescibacteria group bacterium]|nr:hypothetical protein [Patescibacteria group bacterium]
MAVENSRFLQTIESQAFAVHADVAKFLTLFFISTGEIPSPKRINLLYSFVKLSLEQGSGGFDALADKVALSGSSHSVITKTYWQDRQVESFKGILDKANFTYSSKNQITASKEAMASWWKVFHYHELNSRGVEPPFPLRAEFISEAEEDNIRYRESTNGSYVNAMLGIVRPATDEKIKKENEKILNGVMKPVLMAYQAVTDGTQLDLECQKQKPCLINLNEAGLEGLSKPQRLERLKSLIQHEVKRYLVDLEFPMKIFGMGMRKKFTGFAINLNLILEMTKYQENGFKKERYPQMV